jgi:hypothetical protein
MRRRSLVRAACALVAGVLSLTVAPSPAFAGDGPWENHWWSACSNAISYHNGGGAGIAHIIYDAHRSTTRRYVIDWGSSWVDSFQQCTEPNAQVSPYQITITQQFQFQGSSLSCTGGIDASFPRSVGVSISCTSSGSTVTESISATCTTWASHCNIDTGHLEVVAASGSSFYNWVLARTYVVVINTNGTPIQWGTDWV